MVLPSAARLARTGPARPGATRPATHNLHDDPDLDNGTSLDNGTPFHHPAPRVVSTRRSGPCDRAARPLSSSFGVPPGADPVPATLWDSQEREQGADVASE